MATFEATYTNGEKRYIEFHYEAMGLDDRSMWVHAMQVALRKIDEWEGEYVTLDKLEVIVY